MSIPPDDFDIDIEDVDEDEGVVGEEIIESRGSTQETQAGRIKTFISGRLKFLAGRTCPFLINRCRFGTEHWAWERLCTCAWGLVVAPEAKLGPWHGGLLDMEVNVELQPCLECHPEHSQNVHQWHLTTEEEVILHAWRAYREELLDQFGDKHPYRYELSVKLNDEADTSLVTRRQGWQPVRGRGLLSDAVRTPKVQKPN